MNTVRRAVVLGPDLRARGGAERVAVTMASELRANGYETFLAFPGDALDLDGIGTYFGVDLGGVRPVPLDHREKGLLGREELRILSEQLRWKRTLAQLRPDVFVNCLTASEMPPLAPVSLYYVHFPHRLETPGATGLRRAYVTGSRAVRSALTHRGRSFLAGYDIVANSSFTAQHVQSLWGRPAKVLHPPTSLVAVPDVERERRPWILGVGRFQDHVPGHPHKRQDAMIEAFMDLVDAGVTGWELHLAGSVGSREELKRLEDSAAGYAVVFHPDASWEELRDLYEGASVYWHAQGFGEERHVHPEAQEHFGITVVEALGAGLLPLVYDSAGPAEIVSPLSAPSTWRTLDELVALTQAKRNLDASAAAGERAAAVARSRDFGEAAFRERFSALIQGGTSR